MYRLILAEAALERIPEELWKHPAVTRHAARRGKPPGEMLLDVSYHYAAMRGLPEREKRGRPDIAHFSLLEALGSPLARRGLLDVFVHSQESVSLHVAAGTRLPRNYERFLGLIEQVLKAGRAPATGIPLLTAREQSLAALIEELGAKRCFLLRENAPRFSLKQLGEGVHVAGEAVILVGGFPRGDFNQETLSLADIECSVYPESLEAWTIVSRTLCALEELHGLFS